MKTYTVTYKGKPLFVRRTDGEIDIELSVDDVNYYKTYFVSQGDRPQVYKVDKVLSDILDTNYISCRRLGIEVNVLGSTRTTNVVTAIEKFITKNDAEVCENLILAWDSYKEAVSDKENADMALVKATEHLRAMYYEYVPKKPLTKSEQFNELKLQNEKLIKELAELKAR